MSDKNMYAVLAMFAIVITLYALKESHTHFLPDFFGLALALTAPRPAYAAGAVCVLALIRHSPLANGLADYLPVWLLIIVLPGARYMSITEDESIEAESAYKAAISEPKDDLKIEEIPRPVAENSSEMITFGETLALARLVAAERIGLTVAVQIGAAAKSGAKYQKRTAEIKAEIERIKNRYPPSSNLRKFN